MFQVTCCGFQTSELLVLGRYASEGFRIVIIAMKICNRVLFRAHARLEALEHLTRHSVQNVLCWLCITIPIFEHNFNHRSIFLRPANKTRSCVAHGRIPCSRCCYMVTCSLDQRKSRIFSSFILIGDLLGSEGCHWRARKRYTRSAERFLSRDWRRRHGLGWEGESVSVSKRFPCFGHFNAHSRSGRRLIGLSSLMASIKIPALFCLPAGFEIVWFSFVVSVHGISKSAAEREVILEELSICSPPLWSGWDRLPGGNGWWHDPIGDWSWRGTHDESSPVQGWSVSSNWSGASSALVRRLCFRSVL